ncbi:molybdenum cofactor cytidylyltransferase/nicotine blue oxidoreductase [Cellulomonas sp. PhB143]|nr:molybdenum cofactor cytidylyltransferase/nicotine blue oxidoreductase [Cellulomonas sp. PhB143]
MADVGGVVGIVLAAGAGRRYGMPKALVRGDDGVPWVRRACAALRDGGADDVVVALGARADEAARLVPEGVGVARVTGWAQGVGASLGAALRAVEEAGAVGGAGAPRWSAAVVTLVDLPELSPAAVRRVVAAAADPPTALCQAGYGGAPGHPVLIGRAHWGALRASLAGDVGARVYLEAHGARRVDCTDLGGGDDVDVPQYRS